ncbi:DUF2125 domain-containing protein [Falsihalocynthiibacter sp. SS001]|uniref:DUF2125 domain-containing protein n=1 Tax=Falsihalocynthiibacter sp. SS001 TaxID=3349698 RepID=UPI0036D2294E
MSFFKPLGTATIFSALLSGTAIADVTTEQVWNDLQEFYKTSGYTLDVGNQTQDGDTLNIDDIVMTMQFEEDEKLVVSGLSFALTQLDNGTVSITVPEEFPIIAEVEDVKITLSMTTDGMEIIASGDDASASYDFKANSYGLSLDAIEDGDVTITPTAKALAAGITGAYAIKKGEIQTVSGQIDARTLDLDLDFQGQESEAEMLKAVVGLKDVSQKFSYSVPEGIDYQDLPAALAAGLQGEVTASHGGANYDVELVDESDGFTMTGSTATGSFHYGLSDESVGSRWGSKDTKIQIIPSAMPLPVSYSVAETAGEILFPVAKSDTPSDAQISFKISDLALDEMIWNMFDPQDALPHDPMTLIVDLTSKLNLDFNLFDIEGAEDLPEDSFPGELHEVNLEELKLSAVGAELTGEGAFTFNNDDLTTFPGMPAPAGKVSLKLVGGNTLLDKLVEMGFVPQDQALGARMMIGLFANAGAGEDELVSTIEVKEDGSILANDQRIK